MALNNQALNTTKKRIDSRDHSRITRFNVDIDKEKAKKIKMYAAQHDMKPWQVIEEMIDKLKL